MNQRGKNKIWNVEYASSISTNSKLHLSFRFRIRNKNSRTETKVIVRRFNSRLLLAKLIKFMWSTHRLWSDLLPIRYYFCIRYAHIGNIWSILKECENNTRDFLFLTLCPGQSYHWCYRFVLPQRAENNNFKCVFNGFIEKINLKNNLFENWLARIWFSIWLREYDYAGIRLCGIVECYG